MQFDHHLNLARLVWAAHRPYLAALAAAGYTAFPQYCVTDFGFLYTYALALHRGDTLTAFVQFGKRHHHDPITCGGLPIFYVETPAALLHVLTKAHITP